MRWFALVNKILCTHVMHEISFCPTITLCLIFVYAYYSFIPENDKL